MTVSGIAQSQNSTPLFEGNKVICKECGATLGYRTLNGWVEYSIGHYHTVVPTIYFDSMVFETRNGRSCEKAMNGLTVEYKWLDSLRTTLDEEVSVYQIIVESQNTIIADFPKEINALAEQHQAEKNRFKNKLRRVWRIVVLEGGIIIVLLLI